MDGAARAGRWLALESRLEVCGLVSGCVLGDGSDWEARGDEKFGRKDVRGFFLRSLAPTALETVAHRTGEGRTWERNWIDGHVSHTRHSCTWCAR